MASEPFSKEEARLVLRSWFSETGGVDHQLESFDRFVSVQLQEIISENSNVAVESDKRGVRHVLEFGKVCVRPPSIRESDGSYHTVTPQECRLRGLTYCVSVYVDVFHTHTTRSSPTGPLSTNSCNYKEVPLCRIPCMVNSAYCTQTRSQLGKDPECFGDPGAYFIVNGNEKVIISQERVKTNFPLIRRGGAAGRDLHYAEVRSLHWTKTRSTSTLQVHMGRRKTGGWEILATLPFVDGPIPVLGVFILLGYDVCLAEALVTTHLERSGNGDLKELLKETLASPIASLSKEEVREWIGREGTKEPTPQRRKRYVEHICNNEIFPHCGFDESDSVTFSKASFLSMVVARVLRAHSGCVEEDDRDDYSSKRVDTPGILMALLFRQLFRNFLKLLTLQLQRQVDQAKYVSVTDSVCSKRLTQAFKYALSTGNWGINKQSTNNGVAQVLSRMNTVASLSHLRRVNTPINREGKMPKPRQLHPSHMGILCPVETPEGQACGLVENLAMLVKVRIEVPQWLLVKRVHETGLVVAHRADGSAANDLVLVNGVIEGETPDGAALVSRLRELRRDCRIPSDVSVSFHGQEKIVKVQGDGGCLMRPLVRASELVKAKTLIRNSNPLALWSELTSKGVIEFVDKDEENELVVGNRGGGSEPTHYPVHQSAFLGLSAAYIPFSANNQLPRNIFQAAMAKQAVGLFSSVHQRRFDTASHTLHYPQFPLVSTLARDISSSDLSPCGAVAIVAVCAFTGFNQEDSILVSQRALDHGLFFSSYYKVYKDEEKGVGSDTERFGMVQDNATGGRRACYDKIGEDGFPPLHSEIMDKDVVIGKGMATSALGTEKKKRALTVDHSTIARQAEPMKVDRIALTTTKDGNRIVRIKLRSLRVPEIGDKFSSHHGQKGVIGCIVPSQDMPFTADGIVPDFVINPHCIPSRMTIGQLMETLLGKACSLLGTTGDGTPFSGLGAADIGKLLQSRGHHAKGNEVLYSGVTGAPLASSVFIGPCHYQRLRHMVQEKVHARSRGPTQLVTRQPVEGRSRDGGLRYGEMERDACVSHGASGVLLDRMFECSDKYEVLVCNSCGLFAEACWPSAPDREARCRGCRHGGADNLSRVEMPYSFKLFIQEMAALHIAARLRLERNGDHPPDIALEGPA